VKVLKEEVRTNTVAERLLIEEVQGTKRE